MKKLFNNHKFEFVYDNDHNLGGGDWDTIVEWCIKNCTSNDSFIEVGAHLGYMSVIVMQFSQPKQALFIEPDPKTVLLLEQNLKQNKATNYNVIQKLALDKLGLHDFYLNISNAAQNSIYNRQEFENKLKIEVEATTIDELVREYDVQAPIVMKIDAEFSEPLIWKGMKQTLSKIKAIVMEHYRPGYDKLGIDHEAFLKEIENNGFRIENLNASNICLYNKNL